MAEVITDRKANEVRVSFEGRELVIKVDKPFAARIQNNEYVWVESTRYEPMEPITEDDRRDILYDLDGNNIYVFSRGDNSVEFMGHMINIDVRVWCVAYYPPKKLLLVCGKDGDEYSSPSGLYIYNEDGELVREFKEPALFDMVSVSELEPRLTAFMRERGVTELSGFSLCGVSCSERNRVELDVRAVNDYTVLHALMNMDDYTVRIVGYDAR